MDYQFGSSSHRTAGMETRPVVQHAAVCLDGHLFVPSFVPPGESFVRFMEARRQQEHVMPILALRVTLACWPARALACECLHCACQEVMSHSQTCLKTSYVTWVFWSWAGGGDLYNF